MKAIIYCRFSPRRNSDTCESIETQLDFCRQYCKQHKYEIVGEYEDRAMSGSDEERPGLWNAVDAVRRNHILVAYKLDRLAREVYLTEVINRTIAKQGGKIEIVTGCENGETNENKLVRQILAAFAEYERKVTAYRTKMGMLRHQARGRRMSDLTPYGWVRDPDNPALMVEEPTEQAVIKLICQMRDNGVSLRGIAQNLENQNIPSRISPRWNNDGKRWNHLIIKRILSRCKFRI